MEELLRSVYSNICIQLYSCIHTRWKGAILFCFFSNVCESGSRHDLCLPHCAMMRSTGPFHSIVTDAYWPFISACTKTAWLWLSSSLRMLQGFLNPQLKLLISLHIHVSCTKYLAFVKGNKQIQSCNVFDIILV